MQQASTVGLKDLELETLKNELNEIRAGFVRQGTSLNAYLKSKKLHQGNTYKAFDGSWNGKKAQEFRKSLAQAANIG